MDYKRFFLSINGIFSEQTLITEKEEKKETPKEEIPSKSYSSFILDALCYSALIGGAGLAVAALVLASIGTFGMIPGICVALGLGLTLASGIGFFCKRMFSQSEADEETMSMASN